MNIKFLIMLLSVLTSTIFLSADALAQENSKLKLRLVRRVQLPMLKNTIDEIVFSQNGRVAAIKTGGSLVIFNTKTWKPLYTFAANLEKALNQFALSPDGKTVALVRYKLSNKWESRSGISLEICNARTGKLKYTLFKSDIDNYVTYSPDGKTLLTLSHHTSVPAKTLGCWDTSSGQLNWKSHNRQSDSKIVFDPLTDYSFYSHIYYSCGIAFAPNGKTFATEVDGQIEISDALTGKFKKEISDSRGVQAPLIFSEDGVTLATGGDIESYGWYNGPDESSPFHATAICGVKFWDTRTGKLQAITKLDKDVVSSIYTPVSFWPHPNTLLAMSYETAPGPTLFNKKSGVKIGNVKIDFSFNPPGAAIFPGNKYLITATKDSTLSYWTARN